MRRSLLAVLLALVFATPAQAATVQVRTSTEGGSKGPEVTVSDLVIAAGAGEANDIVVTSDGDAVVVADRGAPLEARTGCTALPDGRASCAGPLDGAQITLGDSNDVLESSVGFSRLVADLGAGDDRANLTVAHVEVAGGAGDDNIATGAGNDKLTGGEGEDVLSGGAGRDRVSYRERTAAVAVDLARGTGNGETGEDDSLTGIEDVEGGKGDDDLRGDAAANALDGGDGEDSVDGRAGNDTLDGAKRFIGGAGSDRFRFTESRPSIDCGAGRDAVDYPGGGAIIAPDCERVNLSIGSSLSVLLGSPIRLLSVCGIDDASKRCTGTLEVATRSGTVVARGRATARAARALRVTATLTDAGRRLLRRRRSVDVRVRAVVVEPASGVSRRTVYRDGFFTKLLR